MGDEMSKIKPLVLSLALTFPMSDIAIASEAELNIIQMESQVADVKTFNMFSKLKDGKEKLNLLDNMIKNYTGLEKSYGTLLNLYTNNKYFKDAGKSEEYKNKLQDTKDTLELFQAERVRVNDVLNPTTQNPNTVQTEINYQTKEYLFNRALSAIGADSAYKQGYTGNGVTVAVLDTGLGRREEFNNAKLGYTVINGVITEGAVDKNIHGTHVAGIIGAAKNDRGIHGVAFNSTILPIKVLGDSGRTLYPTDVHRGLKLAVKEGAKVANLSLGVAMKYNVVNPLPVNEEIFNFMYTDSGFTSTPDFSTSGFIQAVNAGMIVVTAAGNDKKSCLPDSTGIVSCGFPAALPIIKGYEGLVKGIGGFIAVGALDETGKLASYSNKAGVTKNWYITAPGSAINSTSSYKLLETIQLSGTSMAAPVVSGAAALLIEKFPHLTGGQITKIIFATADDLGEPGIDDVYGNGSLNVAKAMKPIGDIKLPLGSKIDSNSASLNKTVIVVPAAVASALKSSSLRDAVVLDDFDRAFNIDLTKAVVVTNSKYNFGEFKQLNAGNFKLGLKEGTSEVTVGYTLGDLTIHYGQAAGMFGTVSSGALNTENTRTHYFRGLLGNSEWTGWGAWLDYGVSPGTKNSNSLISETSSFHGIGAGVQYGWSIDKKSDARVRLSSPISVVKGSMNLHVPVARDMDGNIIYHNEKVNIKPSEREVNLGFNYIFRSNEQSNFSAEIIKSYGERGVNGYSVGAKFEMKF